MEEDFDGNPAHIKLGLGLGLGLGLTFEVTHIRTV